MKKFIIGCFMLCFISQYSIAQNQALLRDAEVYSKAMIDSDFEMMIRYTNDKQIELSGGPSYYVKDLEADSKLRQSQMQYKKVTVSSDQEPVVYLQKLQTFVTQAFMVDFGGQDFEVYHHLFAVSDDKGENWTFVDLSKHDAESFREFFPSFSSDLSFPEPKEAKLIEE